MKPSEIMLMAKNMAKDGKKIHSYEIITLDGKMLVHYDRGMWSVTERNDEITERSVVIGFKINLNA